MPATKSPTPRSMPSTPQAGHVGAVTPRVASDQLRLRLEGEAQLSADEHALSACFRAAVNAFGGADALRAALCEKDTYVTRITDAINGVRPVQARWFLPLLEDPRSAMVLLGFLSDRAGFEPPVLHREVSDEEIGRAAAEVIAESGQMRDVFRQQIAKRLGVRVEAVKL